jgi:hypothetical protein
MLWELIEKIKVLEDETMGRLLRTAAVVGAAEHRGAKKEAKKEEKEKAAEGQKAESKT